MSLIKKLNKAEVNRAGVDLNRGEGTDIPILRTVIRIAKETLFSKAEDDSETEFAPESDVLRAVKLLATAADLEHPKAIFSLVQIYLVLKKL